MSVTQVPTAMPSARGRGPVEHLERVARTTASLIAEVPGDDVVWASTGTDVLGRRGKMLVEASLFALLAERAVGRSHGIEAILDALIDEREFFDRTYEMVRWQPHLWTSVGLPWIVFDHFGIGDSGRRARLRHLWGQEVAQPHERSVYRVLDQAWARGLARGTRDALVDAPELLSATSLGNLAGGLFLTTSDLYAVTHAAMYVTDFGEHPMRVADASWLVPLAASRLLIGDFDLAAELVIADLVLDGRRPNTAAVLVCAVLAAIFAEAGCVPAPTFRADEHQNAADPASYLRYHSYHSTLVYGLLCATLCTRERSDIIDAVDWRRRGIPTEWDGRRRGLTNIGDCVVATADAWRSFLPDGASADVLRLAADAYLLRVVREADVEACSRLVAMAGLLGDSTVSRTARSLMRTRRDLHVPLAPGADSRHAHA